MEMLGELELIRLIEENEYPARLVSAGVVWVELEITDTKTNVVRRGRLSKSAFADLILDWRAWRTPHPGRPSPAPRRRITPAHRRWPRCPTAAAPAPQGRM